MTTDKEKNILPPKNNLTGKIFGRLTVISFNGRETRGIGSNARIVITYLCKCVCGNQKIIRGDSLKKGLTTSCGCYRVEQVSKSGTLRRTNGVLMSAKIVWRNSYTDGCDFDLFLKLSQYPCFYCNSPPSNIFNIYINQKGKIKQQISKEWADQSWFTYNGLDRINSDLGHIETNIVPCCKTCNYAKSDMTLDKFRKWAENLNINLITNKW